MKRQPRILWHITLICSHALLTAVASSAGGAAAQPRVSVVSLAAGRATHYSWTVETATYPSGLILKVGDHVGSLVISTNYTRTAAGSIGVVSGFVKVDNPADISLQLSQVQVLVQQPAAGLAPFRSIAECKRSDQGHIFVHAQQSIGCPFAVLLPGSSSVPVVVAGQAMLVGAAQLSSYPMVAVFGSLVSSSSLELGKCAVLTDTFMSGQLYLVPDRVAAGTKMPSLGGGSAVCGSTHSLYRVSFGPYTATVKCGAYKVMNTARVNPLGGDQPPVLASSLVMAQITDCPSAAAPSIPPPVPSPSLAPAPNPSSIGTSSGPQTMIFGPPASSGPAYVAPSPVYVPAATAPAPVPAAATPPSLGGYYYTYEYEATVPSGRRRRLRQHSSQASSSTRAASESSNDNKEGGGGVVGGFGSRSSNVWSSSAWDRDQQAVLSSDEQPVQQPTAPMLPLGERLQQLGMQYLQQQQQQVHQPQARQQAAQPAQQHLTRQGVPLQERDNGQLPAGWQVHMLLQQPLVEPSSSQQHQASLDWGQMQQGLQFGYQLEQQMITGNTSTTTTRAPSLHKPPWHQRLRRLRDSLTNAHAHSTQQHLNDALGFQVLVNAGSREERRQMRRQRRQLQQAVAGPEPGSGSTYYAATIPEPTKPGVGFGSVSVDFGIVAYSWHPKVTVSPAAVTVPLDKIAILQYNVKVLRSELPRATLLRGSVVLRNPAAGLLKLTEVAVEAPAAGFLAWAYASVECPHTNITPIASATSSAANVIIVPARGQLTCSFTLSYPAAAPAQGQVFARAVTEAGRELISTVLTFSRPAMEPPAAQVELGACAQVSDTFLTSANSLAVLEPTAVPTSGSKAPAAASHGDARGLGTVVLCNSAAYTYTATLGPYRAGQCGMFKVVNNIRVRPLNGSMLTTSAAIASVNVNITGCPILGSIAAANVLSAAAVNYNASSYTILASNGAKLALPIVTLQPLEVRPVTSYVWSVKNAPILSTSKLPYTHRHKAGFTVQYKRNAARPGATITGTVTVRNPNLLDPLWLAQVQVELFMPGSTGPVARAWASCPRDEFGIVVVAGQLVGVGTVVCSWIMELLASGSYSDLITAGSSAQLMAVAVTSTGQEGASAASLLLHVPVNTDAKPEGACAALSNSFQHVRAGGAQLMVSSGSDSNSAMSVMPASPVSDLLPGEAGGGRAADVVCDSLSLSYGATYGPLDADQCGEFKTINMAIASPTTGQGNLAAAEGRATIDVVGCPSAAASLDIAALQLQLLKVTVWNVTGRASAPTATAVQVSVGSTADIAFGLRYVASPAVPVRQAVGSVTVKSSGSAALSIAQLLLDVTPVNVDSLGQGPLLTWTANCPGSSSGTDSVASLAVGSSIVCSFSGLVPDSLVGSASVVARLQLPSGKEIASPATVVDFIRSPTYVVTRARCAVVADQFLSGPGLLVPSKTSRPAVTASAAQICNSHSVSFVATLGPFSKAQCGQQLGVVNIARVNPVSTSAVQLPVSTATVVAVNVTGGCSSSSNAKKA